MTTREVSTSKSYVKSKDKELYLSREGEKQSHVSLSGQKTRGRSQMGCTKEKVKDEDTNSWEYRYRRSGRLLDKQT